MEPLPGTFLGFEAAAHDSPAAIVGRARRERLGLAFNQSLGFVNRDLDEVIPPTWDFAFPFVGGFAVVCEGCRSRPVDDEHSEMHGGVWGYINRSGEIVVPIEYERDSLPEPPLKR